MANSVVTLMVAARGAGDNYGEAEARAMARLEAASKKIVKGKRPRDPGVQFEEIDPGDGPCAAKVQKDVLVSSAGLPEARRRDD